MGRPHPLQGRSLRAFGARMLRALALLAIGAGIGIGIIFGKEIESVARQPEMKDELQSIRWLGFALTEAVAFYTFIFGLIAFFL